MNKKTLLFSFLLFCGTFIWGSSFVAQSAGTDYIGPYTFSAVRCFIAVVTVFFILLVTTKLEKKKNPEAWQSVGVKLKKSLLPGLLCGSAHAIAVVTQQVGIYYVGDNTARAGFLTALYVIMVPVLGLFFKRKVKLNMWLGVFLGISGMYVMCMLGAQSALTIGDILLIICSLFYAIQILLLDKYAPGCDPYALSCVQYCVTTTVSAICMVFLETPTVGGVLHSWFPLLYCGILSMGVASTIQVVSQKVLHPAVASLIMSLESVIALVSGWVYFGTTLQKNEWVGCALVFSGVIIAQLDLLIKKKKKQETATE